MAIFFCRRSLKGRFGCILVLLIVLVLAEILYTSFDSNIPPEDFLDGLDGFQESIERTHPEGEALQLDFAETDENWVDSYSKGGGDAISGKF